MDSLKNKVAVIIDADTIIGSAAADVLMKNDCKVVLSGRCRKMLEGITRRHQNSDSHMLIVQSNGVNSAHAILEQTVNKFGTIHIMIVCLRPVAREKTTDASADRLRQECQANIFTPIRCVQAALPHLKNNNGSVVLVSSWTAKKPVGTQSMVSSYRDNIARLAAQELASHKIRLNTVNPFGCQPYSSMLDWIYSFFTGAPLKGTASPRAVAEYIAFVASDACCVTANNFYIDGGHSITTAVTYSPSVNLLAWITLASGNAYDILKTILGYIYIRI